MNLHQENGQSWGGMILYDVTKEDIKKHNFKLSFAKLKKLDKFDQDSQSTTRYVLKLLQLDEMNLKWPAVSEWVRVSEGSVQNP